MNILRMFPVLALAAALVPGAVAAQSPEEHIQGALDRATEVGIPLSLLESKIEEGRAKGIPMDRIAEAIQHRLEGLMRAQEALEGVPDVGGSDLEVAADALESGVSAEVLGQLADTAPRERRAAAIWALTYLVGADVAPSEALDRVMEALARGPEALENLPVQAGGRGPAGTPVGPAGPPPAAPPPEIPVPGDVPPGGRPADPGPPADLPGGGPPTDRPGGPV